MKFVIKLEVKEIVVGKVEIAFIERFLLSQQFLGTNPNLVNIYVKELSLYESTKAFPLI